MPSPSTGPIVVVAATPTSATGKSGRAICAARLEVADGRLFNARSWRRKAVRDTLDASVRFLVSPSRRRTVRCRPISVIPIAGQYGRSRGHISFRRAAIADISGVQQVRQKVQRREIDTALWGRAGRMSCPQQRRRRTTRYICFLPPSRGDRAAMGCSPAPPARPPSHSRANC
jgi:hypothetical protein